MKRLFLIIPLCFVVSFAYAETTIDGYEAENFQITDWGGIPAPAVSLAGSSRIYSDSTSNTLKLSLNTGAYSDILTATSGDSSYLLLSGSNANQNIDIGVYDFTATDIIADNYYLPYDSQYSYYGTANDASIGFVSNLFVIKGDVVGTTTDFIQLDTPTLIGGVTGVATNAGEFDGTEDSMVSGYHMNGNSYDYVRDATDSASGSWSVNAKFGSHAFSPTGGILNTDAVMDNHTAYSVSCWIYLTSLDAGSQYNMLGVWNKGNQNDPVKACYILPNEDGTHYGRVFANIETNGGDRYRRTSQRLALSTWYHLVVTSAGGTAPKIYINSVEDTGWSSNGTGTDSADGAYTLRIGRFEATSSSWFRGQIDEFSWFNKVLSQAEIDGYYANGATPRFNSVGTGATSTSNFKLNTPNQWLFQGNTEFQGTNYFGNQATNYTEIQADGDIISYGTATHTIDTLVLDGASITDTSGAISFGDDNITTTGTLGAGAITGTSLTDGTATLDDGSITGGVNATFSGTINGASIPTADTDPDVDAVGEIGRDTDDHSLRGFDGTNQFVYGQKVKEICFTVCEPDSLAEAAFLPIWTNNLGFDFVITDIYSVCDVDNAVYTLKFTTNGYTDHTNLTTIEAITIATDGTGIYTNLVSGGDIDSATIAAGNTIGVDLSAGDYDFIHVIIKGYYNADVA